MKHLFLTVLLTLTIATLPGCSESLVQKQSTLKNLTNFVEALNIANTTSTPFNPYALPIGIGLTGLTAMLEALRRKEKAGRKHAESILNNGTNGK